MSCPVALRRVIVICEVPCRFRKNDAGSWACEGVGGSSLSNKNASWPVPIWSRHLYPAPALPDAIEFSSTTEFPSQVPQGDVKDSPLARGSSIQTVSV